jgi:hypothetical protein
MSIWGKLFGSEKVIDSGMRAIDALVLTDEEKTKYKLELLKAYEPFKLAQRYFMMIVTVPFMFIWLCVGLSLLSMAWTSGDYKDVKDFILEGEIIWIVITICAFYFGDTIAGKLKNG